MTGAQPNSTRVDPGFAVGLELETYPEPWTKFGPGRGSIANRDIEHSAVEEDVRAYAVLAVQRDVRA